MDLPIPTAVPPATSPLGPVPPLLLWLVGVGLLVITLLLGVWIFLSASRQPSTLDVVGLEAEIAWQALKTGLDLKDVIVKCYRQMSLALEKEGEEISDPVRKAALLQEQVETNLSLMCSAGLILGEGA